MAQSSLKKQDTSHKFSHEAVQLLKVYEKDFNSIELLKRGEVRNTTYSGLFSDDVWCIEEKLEQTYVYISFKELKELLVTKEFPFLDNAIKGFLAYKVIDCGVNNGKTLQEYYRALFMFIKISNYFSHDFLKRDVGDKIHQYFEELECDTTKKGKNVSIILEYIFFLETILNIDDDVYKEYKIRLDIQKNKYPPQNFSRILPKSKDILIFDYVINDYFNKSSNDNAKLLYTPLLIWWRLTNIIPMRISELAHNLSRDCILNENGKYYLKIKRVKMKLTGARLPVLNKIEVSEDIAILIKDYIKLTKRFGVSKTLFSYKAYVSLKKELKAENYPYRFQTAIMKNDDNYFSLDIFSYLLTAFYDDVVERQYKVTDIEQRISPNDTRHFAFFSLLLQGLSPIEIALLGGHTTLNAQSNYQSHVSYYIDLETYKLIHRRQNEDSYLNIEYRKHIQNIFNKMPKQCPIPLNKTHQLRVGVCTCDFKDDQGCESSNCLYFCSKWWCEPTTENQQLTIKYIQEVLVQKENHQLEQDMNFLNQLLSNTSLHKTTQGVNMSDEIENQVITTSQKIKTRCDNLAQLQASLLIPNDDSYMTNIMKIED